MLTTMVFEFFRFRQNCKYRFPNPILDIEKFLFLVKVFHFEFCLLLINLNI